MALDATEVGELFNQVGKSLRIGDVTNTACKTSAGTISAEIEDLTQSIGTDALPATVQLTDAVSGAPKAIPAFVSAGLSLNTQAVQTPSQNLVVQTIKADSQQPNDGALTAVTELIRQMTKVATPQTVNANEPTVSTITYGNTIAGTDNTSAAHATIMTDSTAAFTVDALIGRTIRNVTDGSTGTITDNDATTITVASMSSGTWDSGDVYSVEGNTTASSNNGDGVLNSSTARGDGLVNEHIIPEDIEGTCTSIAGTGQATWQLKGEASVGKMSPDWPGGSGITNTLTSYIGASGSNLVNGSFEVADTNSTNLPLGWIATVATLGTTLNITPVEIQTIVISGIPTGGTYTITFPNKDGDEQDTVPLVYNATGSAVQSALRALIGLAEITVVTTGTIAGEDYTHTITMTGVTNPSRFTSTSSMTGGTPVITHDDPTDAVAQVMRGARSLEFDNDEAQNTSIIYPVTLQPATVYALSAWAIADTVPSGGTITIDLVDSSAVSPTTITDDQATSNTVALDVTTLSNSAFQQTTAFFRTPTIMPTVVYLRIRVSTVTSFDQSVFFDEVCLVPAIELYPGGPFAALFSGPTDWVVGDELKFSPVNAQAGLVHTWMDRIFDLAANRLLIGSATAGGETINDNVIA